MIIFENSFLRYFKKKNTLTMYPKFKIHDIYFVFKTNFISILNAIDC